MTYKAIVKAMVENEARAWVKSILEEAPITYDVIIVKEATLNINKEENQVDWEVEVFVLLPGFRDATLTVFGYADDWYGVSKVGVQNSNGILIWLNLEDSREALGITEFKIA